MSMLETIWRRTPTLVMSKSPVTAKWSRVHNKYTSSYSPLTLSHLYVRSAQHVSRLHFALAAVISSWVLLCLIVVGFCGCTSRRFRKALYLLVSRSHTTRTPKYPCVIWGMGIYPWVFTNLCTQHHVIYIRKRPVVENITYCYRVTCYRQQLSYLSQ